MARGDYGIFLALSTSRVSIAIIITSEHVNVASWFKLMFYSYGQRIKRLSDTACQKSAEFLGGGKRGAVAVLGRGRGGLGPLSFCPAPPQFFHRLLIIATDDTMFATGGANARGHSPPPSGGSNRPLASRLICLWSHTL